MCVSFYYLNDSTDQCTGQWCYGCTPKDELPNQRRSLAKDIASHTIEQANEEF